MKTSKGHVLYTRTIVNKTSRPENRNLSYYTFVIDMTALRIRSIFCTLQKISCSSTAHWWAWSCAPIITEEGKRLKNWNTELVYMDATRVASSMILKLQAN